MKLRDLKHRFEGFSDRLRARPPIRVPGGRGPSEAFGADGVPESVSVRRVEERLSLRMRYRGREHIACFSWDPPPSLTEVEQVLRAHLEQTITDIGDLDV
jgi:hypothetical protein